MEVRAATIGLTRSITFGTAASVARISESSGTSSPISSRRGSASIRSPMAPGSSKRW